MKSRHVGLALTSPWLVMVNVTEQLSPATDDAGGVSFGGGRSATANARLGENAASAAATIVARINHTRTSRPSLALLVIRVPFSALLANRPGGRLEPARPLSGRRCPQTCQQAMWHYR